MPKVVVSCIWVSYFSFDYLLLEIGDDALSDTVREEDEDEDTGGLFTGCWGRHLSRTSVFIVLHYLFASEKMQSPGCPQFTEGGAELLKPFLRCG